jgi:outer membrane lipoprotein-sorting protein
MRPAQKKITFVTIAFVLILGCSAPGQTAVDSDTTKPAPLMQGQVIKEGDEGSAFIGKMQAVAEQLNNYSSEYKMIVYKPRNTQTETGIFYFRKPKLMRVEVRSGPKKGSLAVLQADGKVHGRMGGLMKMFSGTLSPDSNLLRALNGFPMVGTDFASLAKYLKVNMLDQGDKSRLTSRPISTKFYSSPVYVLDMFAVSAGKEILKKRIFVEPDSKLPVFWQDYHETKLWSESSWSGLKNEQALASNLFTN